MKKILIGLSILILLVLPLINAGDYGDGKYGAGVYGIGEVISTPGDGDTPGGGETPTCTYDWDCTAWFPAECPEVEIQERICANRGTCTGTMGMPNQTQTCVYGGPTEPLFDMVLVISEKHKEMCAGQKIKAKISLINLGKTDPLDVFMTYWIINANNTLIAELKDTRKVEDKSSFDIEMKIPQPTPEGTYRLYAQIDYEDKTAVAGESFEIMDASTCKIEISQYIYFSLIGIISLLIIILIILIIRRIKKRGKSKQIVEDKNNINNKNLTRIN